eukprot:s2168_g4.t1
MYGSGYPAAVTSGSSPAASLPNTTLPRPMAVGAVATMAHGTLPAHAHATMPSTPQAAYWSPSDARRVVVSQQPQPVLRRSLGSSGSIFEPLGAPLPCDPSKWGFLSTFFPFILSLDSSGRNVPAPSMFLCHDPETAGDVICAEERHRRQGSLRLRQLEAAGQAAKAAGGSQSQASSGFFKAGSADSTETCVVLERAEGHKQISGF